MSESAARGALGILLLLGLWCLVYWWWRPGEPAVSFDLSTPPTPPASLVADGPAPSGGDPPPQPAEPPAPPARSPETTTIEHRVQPGDTLGGLSLRYYGTTTRAAEIFEANRDLLRDPAALQVGQTLRIPGVPTPGDAGVERAP